LLKLFNLSKNYEKAVKKLMPVLNSLLSDELTAINQYMVHSEMVLKTGVMVSFT